MTPLDRQHQDNTFAVGRGFECTDTARGGKRSQRVDEVRRRSVPCIIMGGGRGGVIGMLRHRHYARTVNRQGAGAPVAPTAQTRRDHPRIPLCQARPKRKGPIRVIGILPCGDLRRGVPANRRGTRSHGVSDLGGRWCQGTQRARHHDCRRHSAGRSSP